MPSDAHKLVEAACVHKDEELAVYKRHYEAVLAQKAAQIEEFTTRLRQRDDAMAEISARFSAVSRSRQGISRRLRSSRRAWASHLWSAGFAHQLLEQLRPYEEKPRREWRQRSWKANFLSRLLCGLCEYP